MNNKTYNNIIGNFADIFNEEMDRVKKEEGFADYVKAVSVSIHNGLMADFIHAVKVGYLGNHWLSGESDIKVLETRKGSNASEFDLILVDDFHQVTLNIEFKTRLKNDKTYNEIMRSVEADVSKLASNRMQTKIDCMFNSDGMLYGKMVDSAGMILILMYERSMRNQMPFPDYEPCECIIIIGQNHSRQLIKTRYVDLKNTLLSSNVTTLADWVNSLLVDGCGDWFGEYFVGMDIEKAMQKKPLNAVKYRIKEDTGD